MKELSKKKYVTLITIMILVLGIIGIVNIGNIDLDKGKVKLKSASIEKLKSSVIESKGYEEITYPVLYELEKVEGIEERNVIIKGTLTKEENKYARFKEITSTNITSTVSENGREIEIKIEKVKLGRQNKINVKIEINGAINETKIKPEIEIKEESEKEYTKVNTEEIEVKTNSVTGLVQDEEGMSVSNLELSINKGNEEIRRTYTDENGRYVFSDVEEGKYIIKVEEENYELKEIKEVEVIGGITENIIVKKIKPYEIEVNKYISKIKLNNNGKEIEYEYGKLNKVNQTVKNLKNLSGEIEYKIEIKNTGEKSGEITKIEEEVTEGLKFNKEKNTEWEEKNGKIINRSLEGIKLKAGEEKEITLKLDIEKTDEARSYLQKVTAKGEVYQNVVYILDGKEYRKEKVLDGETIEEPKIVQENFKGWYTDKKYTNKYNFKNSVTKDIILYGKIEESTKKYTVQYIDEGKIIKEEELEEGSIINAPEVTKEGYTFGGWYEGEEKYDVYEPITRNLILESKYEINKYKVRFINEDESVLQEETLDYGSIPTYKKETPTKKRTEEYTYEFDKWLPEITKVTSNQEYKATYKAIKNKYTVTYINDGEEYHKETVEYGSVITSIQDPIKEGYTFIGWYTKDNEKISYPITVTKNITLYSKYEVNSYKVSYYNEGKKYIDDQKINYGENALKPNTNPSKIGYTFKYWSLKENGEEYEFSTKITKDIALYAVYEINKYTVTYINEGIEYHKETAEYGSVITEIKDPTKEGYTFTGWYTKDNEKVSYPITVTENITLYSKYEINSYKVSYYNEGTKYIDDQQINYGENALKPNTDPEKIGYTFKYWSLKENGEEYEFSTKITKDITLYAVYEINKYTVTYINEGVEYHKETIEYGSAITEIQDPIKEGYTFIGWYTKDNEKVSYPITVTKNITLYSKYEINSYKVSYYNEGKKYIDDQKINYGENAVKPSIDPTKEDYNFSGWVIKGTNNKYDFTSKVTKNIELESSFTAKPTYTVTFKIGNEVILTENVIEGHKVTSKEAPYKKGYLFDKWYSDEELTIENNFDEKIMGNKTIYGKYNENKHTVTYINEGTTYYTEEVLDRFTAKGPSENPSKEGYTFKYFSKDKKVAFDYNSEITEDTTLYAVYEINKYTVTYINEGSEYHKEELTYGSKHEKIEDPFKTGYTFIGWYNENEEKVEYPITVTKDITLHSKYEINKYTVTYMNEGTKYIEDQQINYREKAVKPETNPSKIGYTFKYWSVKENGEEYNFNSEITEDITLYAVYEINKYTVTYINEGSEYHKEELTYGSKHEKIEDPFKRGYTFIGWYNENEEKVEYPITVTKDITLHSKYEINKYTVTFNDEDRITIKEVNYNAKVEPVTNQGKTGYTFKYWSKEKGGEEYNFNSEITENITLYAIYNINKYTVTFKNYDGSTLQEETLEYGTLPKYKGEAPTREKTKEYTYTFKGWDKEITEVTNNQEYKATYTETKNKYNVKFTNYDGSTLQEETLEYGTIPVYKGEIPTREKTDEYTYTFKNWNKEITEVTDNEIYIAVYKEEKNKYTVIYMDGEKEYTRKEVNYGETVSEEVISKDHNIYRGWTLDGNVYDFNTPVTKNITIKSSFELVESPIIESTPIEWTKENVKVTITTNHNDYSYMYKIDDGEYQKYNGEFTVDKNCTVIAKSIKENVESEVTTKEITNIDKVLPEIKEIIEENITTKSFDIKVKGQDNESGLSEIRIYKNEELMVSYPYTERLNEEKEETYSLTGLEENTTYKIKVELIDKVGNINVSEEKEITTLKRVIVSRIIGRNNSLYESEEEYELFESLEEAITACGSNECTIEMVLDTKESVNVLEGQEIKLELNGKTVTGVRDYTIENSGELIIVDKEETEGGIINNTDTAIKNIESGILQIGENEEPLSVSMTKPNIVGTTYGIYTEEETSKLKFYDGKIEGNVAIQGNVDDTPYLYNAKITNEGHQVATLSILAEAEAKITGGKYYTKLSNAVSETESGTYKEEDKNIMSTVKTKSIYSFDYNEEENALISNNQKQYNQSAYSYIKLDLTNYTKDQELIVTGEISTYQNYGYAIVTENTVIPTYNQTNGRVLYMTGQNETKTETGNIVLEKGKIYYLHIGYNKSSGWNNYTDNTDTFKITNITLSDYIVSSILDEETNIVTQDSYGFVYQDGVLKSNNQKQRYTTANSYIKVDLTNSNFNRKIYIDAELHATAGDYGLITINNSEDVPSYSDTNGRIFYRYGNVSSKVYTATLEAGKVYYIHFGYKKNNGYDDSIDAFIINSITYNKGEPKNPISRIPVLNEKVDTVELIKDITLTSPMEINETKEMLLDLKGYTLTTTSNDYVIKNSGDLTVIDSKYSADQDKNQADYEAEQAKNQADYEAKQAEYDKEYNEDLDAYNKTKEEYEKQLEEYEKKFEEYNAAHPNKAYEYTGKEEIYVVPEDGTYKLETWGAQGGSYNETYHGGYGGYSSGYITLKKGDKLYINVGGQGSYIGPYNTGQGGYNGGGSILLTHSDGNEKRATGGGATHISLKSGLLSTLENSKDDILIVSGGGGAAQVNSAILDRGWGIGGSGGGINGSSGTGKNYSTDVVAPGGTQTQSTEGNINSYSGVFGKGGENSSTGNSSGGGGGFYGGSSSLRGAGGGSGYIGNSKLTNKAMYCYNCEESSDESTKTISTNDVSETPTENYAKKGAGYAKITKVGSEDATDFNYTGDVQEYNVPKDGKYKIELWGASGGIASDSSIQGRGGYTSGTIDLKKNDKLYIYVGERGSNSKSTTFNGGGSGGNSNLITLNSQVGNSGGGATDVRLEKGKSWNNFDSLKSRIMVAGGSGGGSGNTLYESAGNYSAAGGLIGYDGGYYSGHSYSNQNGKGATQTSGGKAGNNHFSATGVVEFGTFGKGGNNYSYSDNTGAGGGGGGYYGGGAGGGTLSEGYGQGAGGGSSFISGHEGCDSISKDSTENNIIHTGKSLHYSNYIFTDTKIIDGLGYEWTTEKTIKTGMPTYDGLGTITGNLGNGHAKITKIDENEETITKPVMPEILKDNNVEMKSDNFSYKALNSSSSGMNISDKKVNFYTSWSNTSVTYYTKKVIVEEGQKLRAKGSLGLWHNYNNGSSLGTAYIGFSKTKDINTTDFDSYTTREITSTTEQKDDFDVMISEPGEYYFKIVLYHISYNSNTLYANLYNLLFTNVPQKKYATLKEATLKQAVMTGTITSTTNSVIYNDNDANLTLRDGIFTLNKAGSSSKYLDLIENDGTLNIKENANLIVNSSYNNVINNKTEGKLVTTNPTLNIKNSYSNGIYNQSKKQDSFSGLKINSSNSSNTNGINTITNKDIEISGVEIKGSYNAGIYIGNGTITINDSIVSGSSNIGIDNSGTLLINSGTISTTSSYGIYNRSKLTVAGGTIIGKSYGMINFGNGNDSIVTIIDGTITGTSYGIDNNKGTTIIDGGTIMGSTGISNGSNGGTLIINDGTIKGTSYGINNYKSGIATIKGGTITSTSTSNSTSSISNKGTLTVGEKDGEVSIESPTIIGNNYGISNSGIFNFYDGKVVGSIGKWLSVYVSDNEDNYDINIETKENIEEVTLAIPSEKIVMLASTSEKYSTVQEAINAAGDGDTIEVLKDIETVLCNEITENKNITIDLRGNNVKNYKKEIYIANSGTLEIKDSGKGEEGSKTYGKIENTGGTIIDSNNVLYLKNIIMTSNGTAITNNESGILEINNATITASSTGIANNNTGKVTINKGTITGYDGINNASTEKVIINGGSILSIGGYQDSNEAAIINSSSGIVEINDGTIKANASYSPAISNRSTGRIIVRNGTITGSISSGINNGDSGIIEIFGGNISGSGSDGISNSGQATITGGNILGLYNSGQTTITGGTIDPSRNSGNGITNSKSGMLILGEKDGTANKESPVIIGNKYGINNSGIFNFYDGIIKGKTNAISGTVTEIEEGYEIIKETIDGYEVKYLDKLPIAKLVNKDKEYTDLQEAINDAETGETIEILRDATFISSTETIEVSESKNIVIDLKGYILTRANSTLLNNKGTLEIKDSGQGEEGSKTYGKIENTGGTAITNNESGILEINNATITASSTGIANNNTGKVTINKGTITGYDGINNASTEKVIINGGSILSIGGYQDSNEAAIINSSSGIVEINDGTIKANASYSPAISNRSTGRIIVRNGTITGSISSGINNGDSGIIEIFGGNISGSGSDGISNSGQATIIGGNILGLYNSGQTTITGGTIDPSRNSGNGITNSKSGMLILGEKDGTANKESPVIIGNKYGINNSGIFNFYDGIIKGKTNAISGTVTEIEEGYEIIKETIDGYEVKYLDKLPIAKLVNKDKEYTDLQEAINDAETGETIEILRDATFISSTETIEVSESKNIVIDLKGYILTRANSTLLNNKGTLEIKDSGQGEEGSKTYGKIENTGGTAITNNESGILEINNATITASSTGIANNNTGKVTINKGTITGYDGINNASTEKVIINGGSILSIGGYQDSNEAAIINSSSGIVEINDGTIKANASYSPAISNRSTGRIIVRNGTITGSISSGINNGDSGIIEIFGGNISGSGSDGISNSGQATITGGNILGLYNSGQTTITGGTIDPSRNSGNGITNSKSGMLILGEKDGTANKESPVIIGNKYGINNSGIFNFYDGIIKGNNAAITNSGGTVNIENVTLSESNIGINNNSGIVNIAVNVTINANNIGLSNSGIINIGTKDGNVSTEMPVITGKTYGVSNENSGKVNFYDGIVSGESGAFSGTVNEVEPGYKIVTNKTDTLTSATLTLVGDDEKVAVLNGINFTSLQDAINSASDTNESIITLYKDVTFESNITVPANKNIKLYLNGYTLNKGSYDFTGEGKITVIDGTSTNALANIMESVKEVLNIEGIKKNIIIYEMDDGSTISSESTYKLYKDNEEVILEEDAIGIYSVGNSNDEIRSANNKIYINELPKGKYKLIGDNNKEVKFEIDESGKIIGNVKENTKETRKLVSTSVAELIIMIQTGIEKVNYIMIILTLLVTISSLLYIVKKVNVKES